MLKKTVRGLMVLTALLWSTSGAQAGDLLKNMQVDVFALGGGSTLIDALYFASAGRQYHSGFRSGYKFTVGASVPYGKFLSIETSYSEGPNNWVVTNQQLSPRVEVVYPVRVYSGNMSAVVHLPFSLFKLRPYADGGVEFDHFSPTPGAIAYAYHHGVAAVSTAIINHNDKLGLSAGFGIDRKLMKRLTFRLDLRDHVTSSPAFGLPPYPTAGNAVGLPVTGRRANNIQYTAGIVLHLGKL